MKKILLAGALLLAALHGFSQSKKLVIHSLTGFSFPGAGDLNDELRNADLLEVGSVYFSRGAGFYTVFPKLRLVSLTSFQSYSGTKEKEGKSSSVRGTQIGSSLGLQLTRREGVELVPFAGLAYSFFGVRSASTSPAGGTGFSNYLVAGSNQNHISTNQWLAQVGVQLVKEGIGQSRLAQRIAIGARTGIFLPLGDPKWKTNDTQLSGGPGVNSGGYYLSLLFGFVQ